MGHYLIRNALEEAASQNLLWVQGGFLDRGITTQFIFVYGLSCAWIGRHFNRQIVARTGLLLAGSAIGRIVILDFLILNPLWSGQMVGEYPLFNALLFVYGLPILWTWRTNLELGYAGKPGWKPYGTGFILLLVFVLLSLNVRQIFHGTYLSISETSTFEIYIYSMAWLLLGVFLLLLGTLRKDKLIRVASLLIMILTIGKVFLYDASQLVGVFRVFSFCGLDLSLLGLSWFYTRFVFGNRA